MHATYNIRNFRQFLISGEFNFKEKVNGHFQIFDTFRQLSYQVWATTEKMMGVDDTSIVGMLRIQDTLTAWWATQHSTSTPIGESKDERDPVAVRTVSALRQGFQDCYNSNKGQMDDGILVTAVRLPNGATEIATNHYQVENKMVYILNAYDENMKLKTNTTIQMTGFMLV